MSEAQQLTKGSEPFATTDAELVLSLLTAGCAFADAASGGPAQMHFTPEVCRSRWVTVAQQGGEKIRVQLLPSKPVSPEQFELAVMRAVKMQIPGIVTYYIARDTVFREAIAAHDAMVKRAAEAARDGVEMSVPNLQAMSEAAMIMTVCYIRRRNKADMEAHSWLRSPNLVLGETKKTLMPKDGVDNATLEQLSYTASGHGRIWALDLPDAKRATIMSDGKPFIHPKPRP